MSDRRCETGDLARGSRFRSAIMRGDRASDDRTARGKVRIESFKQAKRQECQGRGRPLVSVDGGTRRPCPSARPTRLLRLETDLSLLLERADQSDFTSVWFPSRPISVRSLANLRLDTHDRAIVEQTSQVSADTAPPQTGRCRASGPAPQRKADRTAKLPPAERHQPNATSRTPPVASDFMGDGFIGDGFIGDFRGKNNKPT